MQRWIGLGLLAVSTIVLSACQPANPRAAANKLHACEIALARHDGDKKLDEEIRRVQQKIRASQREQQALPLIESLGWSYVEKARTSFDPGFYKLAEQCAACLEARINAPSEGGAPNAQAGASVKGSAMLLRGHVLHSLHRFAESEAVANELVKSRGLAFDYGLLGDAQMEQGKLEEAVAAYQKMMELKPSPQAYSRAAHVYWLKGDLKSARALMRLSAQASGQGDTEASAWAWSKLALYELQAGELKRAQATCDLALTMQPGYTPALLVSGRILLAESKFNEAIAPLEQAARLNPLPEYLWTLAEALRASGRNDDALQAETKLAERGAGDDPRTYAVYLATRGERPALALMLTEQELKSRCDVFTLDALAWAQSSSARHQDAWQTMQSALATGTQDARLFLHAAVVAAKSDHPNEARDYLKRASSFQHTLLPSEKVLLRRLKV